VGFCHFFLQADQFFLLNQIVLTSPVVYRIDPWTARPKTTVSLKLFYNSCKFYWFLLFSIGGSRDERNRERRKVLL